MIKEEKNALYNLSLILMAVTLSGCNPKVVVQQETTLSTTAQTGDVETPNTIIEEENKIKIVSPSGEVIKEISLLEEEKIVDTPYETDGYKHKVKKNIIKRVAYSRNKKYIGLVVNEHNIGVILKGKDGKEEEKSFEGEGEADGRLTIYNLDGKVVFYKEMPPKRWLHFEPLISDNLESIVVYTQWTGSSSGRDIEERDIVYVFDREGREKIIFPTEQEYRDGYRISDIPDVISHNGRYLAIDTERYLSSGYGPIVTRFYDLENKTYWDLTSRYVVFEISTEGVARVDNAWNSDDKTTEINLKEYLDTRK